jgi:hypothetical protein
MLPAPEEVVMQLELQLRLQKQRNAVADEVSAVTAVVRPILQGILYGIKREVADESGGYEGLKLFMLARLRKPGDGDTGICFEYAVHDAVTRREPAVMERVEDVLSRKKWCNLPGDRTASILFGIEKAGTQQLIETAKELLTEDSVLMPGRVGRPFLLRKHIDKIARAFRSKQAKVELPQSIAGLWKTDLFLGRPDSDRWVATTVKINAKDLQGASGLRIGIVPSKEGASDKPWRDERRNLVVCPLPHDYSFMQVFYSGWEVVQSFLNADARLPREVALPYPALRQVARWLEARRDFPVVDVIEALGPLAQPELLETNQKAVNVIGTSDQAPLMPEISAVIAPLPKTME